MLFLFGILNIKNINFKNLGDYLIQDNNKSWIITSIIYASYNNILLIPVLVSIKNYIVKDKNIKYISIIVTSIITILLTTIYLILINIDVNIKELEMPAIYAIDKISSKIKNIYGIIILISIFTTAISLGISFLKNVSTNEKSYNIISISISLSSIIFSKIGFSNLVNLFYPILGILGAIQILQIFYKKPELKCKNILQK